MVVEVDWRVEETQKNRDCKLLFDCVYTHTGALVGGNIFVHGGCSMGVGTLNMLYDLDIKTKSWQNIQATTASRALHAILLVDDKIYIPGGTNEASMKRWDIVTQEMEEGRSRKVSWSVQKINQVLCSHVGVLRTRKSVFDVWWGTQRDGILGFHVDSGIRERLTATGAKQVNRVMHTSCMVGDCMYISGGKATDEDAHDLNDLSVLTLHPRPASSTLVELHGIGRIRASLMNVAGRLVVYGGRHSDAGVAAPKSENLSVFNILSEKPYIQEETPELSEGIQSHSDHTAIVQEDEILFIGGIHVSSSAFDALGSIFWLSVS